MEVEKTPPATAPSVVIMRAADESAASYPKVTANRSGWLMYGKSNMFPQELIAINSKSPVNSSIIASTVTYVCGKGVRDTAGEAGKYVGRPNPVDTWDDIIERIATDYKTFGGFYKQVVVNKGSTTVSLFHQDFSAVRVGKISETGEPLTFRISNDWKKTSGKNKPLELEVWPGMRKAKKGQAYISYYWDYVPGMVNYTVPNYYSAEAYIRADGKLGPFYNNSIDSNFVPSVTISMPSNPGDDVKEAFQREMEEAYGGNAGACSIVILWGENDAVKPTITPFQAAKNADIYINVESQVFQKIISAHRLSSPTLAGVSGSGNLSGNAAEIIDAYILYNYTVIEKLRRRILDQLNIFTAINRTAPLTIDELDVLAKIKQTQDGAEEIASPEGIEGAVESLASKLGVGGTQALTAIMENPAINDTQKRGLLTVLFGLTDDEVNRLFGGTQLSRLLNKLSRVWKSN